MRKPGQIGLLESPQTDLTPGKRRPVLLLVQGPGPHGDWWVCMLSSQSSQAAPDRLTRIRRRLVDWLNSAA